VSPLDKLAWRTFSHRTKLSSRDREQGEPEATSKTSSLKGQARIQKREEVPEREETPFANLLSVRSKDRRVR
jgi:hypothetical protein